MNKADLLTPTILLNFKHRDIETLIEERSWKSLSTYDTIGAVYDFVRNEIKFGYNRTDGLSAVEVLNDGYGQCNTKGTLLMALLRALSVPCRIRGLTIHKYLQRGVMPEFIFSIVPDNILHSWVEIFYDDQWITLEGFILDEAYLSPLQDVFEPSGNKYCGYGIGTRNIKNPMVKWAGRDTYIQSTGINQDFGIYASPDELFSERRQDFSWWKSLLYERIIRHWMNYRVGKIRKGHRPAALPTDDYCAPTPDAIKNRLEASLK